MALASEPERSVCMGLLGSLVFAFHLHQYDYVALILAACWSCAAGRVAVAPPLLLAGVATMQRSALATPSRSWSGTLAGW